MKRLFLMVFLLQIFLLPCRADSVEKLFGAVMKGDRAGLETLLAGGADVNIRNKKGKTLLMDACGIGNSEIINLLLKYKANPDMKDKQGNTALLYAVNLSLNVNTENISILIKNGADLNVKNYYGISPLIAAAGKGEIKAMKLLIDSGADLNSKYKKNSPYASTPLIRAAENGHYAAAVLLLENGAKVNLKDWQNMSALGYASLNKNNSLMNLLKKTGAK